MNKWDIADDQHLRRKVLVHDCGEHSVNQGGHQGYMSIGFLNEFICTECQALAPQEMVDIALLAGARLTVKDLYGFQMNVSYKVLLTIMAIVENKLNETA